MLLQRQIGNRAFTRLLARERYDVFDEQALASGHLYDDSVPVPRPPRNAYTPFPEEWSNFSLVSGGVPAAPAPPMAAPTPAAPAPRNAYTPFPEEWSNFSLVSGGVPAAPAPPMAAPTPAAQEVAPPSRDTMAP